MWNFVISTIIWTFSIYGLFEFIKKIIFLFTYTKINADGIYFIIAVKNQEDKIEGFLRSMLFKILYGKEEYVKDVFVVDLNSKDDTRKIVGNLSKEYEKIQLLSWKECKELLENIND